SVLRSHCYSSPQSFPTRSPYLARRVELDDVFHRECATSSTECRDVAAFLLLHVRVQRNIHVQQHADSRVCRCHQGWDKPPPQHAVTSESLRLAIGSGSMSSRSVQVHLHFLYGLPTSQSVHRLLMQVDR